MTGSPDSLPTDAKPVWDTARGVPPDAFIFDLDGTLTTPALDFGAIRREIGGLEGPILEALRGWEAPDRERAFRVLETHELYAAATAVEMPGAAEVLRTLRERGFATAILTRNHRRALEATMARLGLEVDATRTREDGPSKPLPDPVLDLCTTLGASPERTLVVGDFRFDLESARAAGAVAVLLQGASNHCWRSLADIVIHDLRELLRFTTR